MEATSEKGSALAMLQDVGHQVAGRATEVLRETGGWGYALSVAMGIGAALWNHIFGFLTLLFAAAVVADWYLGRRRAHRDDEYDEDTALSRTSSKVVGYGLILVLWLLEGRVVDQLGWFEEGGGLVATVVLMLYLIDELDSVERNRIRLGARPLPLWTQAIAFIRGATSRVVPRTTPNDPAHPGAPSTSEED